MARLRLLLAVAVTVGATASSCSSSDSSNGSSTGGDSGTASGSGSSTEASGSSGSSGPSASSSSGSSVGTRGGSTSSGSSGSDSGSGGSSGSSGSSGAGDSGAFTGPCDIYGSGGTPCVAAHSTVRALYGNYRGSLYQVTRASDHATKDIGFLSAGGFANGAAQDAFCSGTTCVTSVVYDQSGNGNDLWYQGSSVVPGSTQSSPATATAESLHPSGNKVYSLYINPGNSYWHNGSQSGVPTGSQPEELYMVTSGTHYNAGCCFDYGNSETDRKADGAGAIDTINFGSEVLVLEHRAMHRIRSLGASGFEYASGRQETPPRIRTTSR